LESHGLVREFFTSDENFGVFQRFIAEPRNKAVLSAALKDKPGWTAKAFMDIVKTEEGRMRLANAMVDQNGNEIICSLAESPASEQCIFTLLNCGNPSDPQDKPGVDVMAKVMAQEGSKSAVTKIIWAIAKNRRFGLKKGLPDIPPEMVDAVG
ncbi:MAG: hypothetical protein KKD39_08620, partial [Candidatus Altiarchaeota archaeon]|nr:hypothetical protein [Candidatus Altiarchaeota archaeon]